MELNEFKTSRWIYSMLVLTFFTLGACSNDELAPGEERSDSDEAEITDQMMSAIETISLNRAGEGQILRVNQSKTLGCLDGVFRIEEDLPAHLSQGLFALPGEYQARVRFANASVDDDTEKDFRGMSVKVFGVEGDMLWGDAQEQHFLFNSYPALFASNPDEFLAFLEANADDAAWKFFINPFNWDSVAVLLRGREVINSPFDIRYWSTTPYRHGDDPDVAVKYSVRSCSTISSDPPESENPDFLRQAMQQHLAQGPACFEFMVQFQQDPVEMPVEDAAKIWDEEVSPFTTVATLVMEDQPFATPQAMDRCEDEAFNPWQSLPAHRPLGGINRVRRAVYAESSRFRLQQNQTR